jgi:hypothetical protein
VLVDGAGHPVLIDIEGRMYFDAEWEPVAGYNAAQALALITWPPSRAVGPWGAFLASGGPWGPGCPRDSRVSPPGHRNGPWGCVVPEARQLALCGARPGGCGVPLRPEVDRGCLIQ